MTYNFLQGVWVDRLIAYVDRNTYFVRLEGSLIVYVANERQESF